MPVGPYSQDVLTRTVNVHWGGGAIVVVGVEVADVEAIFGRIYRGTPADAEAVPPKLQDWTTVIEGSTAFRAISHALVNGTPTAVGDSIIEVGGTLTFVMGGAGASTVEIHHSADGENWSAGLSRFYPNVGAGGVMGIVWDPLERAFFAASGAMTDSGAIFAQRQLWRSVDGRGWSQLAELTSSSDAETEAINNQITTMLLAHATKPENRGGSESKVPDGYQAYDPNKKIFM